MLNLTPFSQLVLVVSTWFILGLSLGLTIGNLVTKQSESEKKLKDRPPEKKHRAFFAEPTIPEEVFRKSESLDEFIKKI